MPNELQKLNAQAKEFAALHVADLARELREWQDTSICPNGKLKELALMLRPMEATHSLKLAESFATRAALDLAAAINCTDSVKI